jgi:hypothetical protein
VLADSTALVAFDCLSNLSVNGFSVFIFNNACSSGSPDNSTLGLNPLDITNGNKTAGVRPDAGSEQKRNAKTKELLC